jgi:hypothetical protein
MKSFRQFYEVMQQAQAQQQGQQQQGQQQQGQQQQGQQIGRAHV